MPRPRANRRRNGTFSSRTQGGLRSAMRRKMLRTSPECRPRIPPVLPACEMSWHGNPAVNNSMSHGNLGIALTSTAIRTPGKRRVSTARARESISQSRDVSNPACSSPSSIPPTPANRPATFTGLCREEEGRLLEVHGRQARLCRRCGRMDPTRELGDSSRALVRLPSELLLARHVADYDTRLILLVARSVLTD